MDSQIRMKQHIIVSDGKTTLGNLRVKCLPLPTTITMIKLPAGLARLNFLYERRFPGLCFVTFVAGRPRKTIADELEKLLGSEVVGLAPQNAQLDPDDLKQSWSGFPSNQVLSRGSAQWKAELERGEGALWEIAGARAAKLTEDVAKGQVTVEILTQDSTVAQPTLTATDSDAKPAPVADEKQDAAAFDTPFLSQATFRALILASPILHSFFEEDLPSSVLLQPVERHTTTKEALLSAYNDATGGVSSSSGRPVVTRERVKGLLGGLLGEVADAVGGRLQQRTVSGPKPAFAARGPSAAKRGPGGLAGLSLEEAAGGKMAPVSPAALSARGKGSTTGALDEKEERQKAQYAAREVQAAHEALLNRDQRSETNQFVIDAPGEDGDETVDIDEEEEEDADLAALAHADDRGDPVGAGSSASKEEKGRLSGKEAALAKGECVAGSLSPADRLVVGRSALFCSSMIRR